MGRQDRPAVNSRCDRCRRSYAALLLLLVPLLTIATPAASQDDIKAFGITDIGGEFSIRYRLDDWSNYNTDGDGFFVNNPTWYEELSLRARGYVYHPAFLDWTISGGPLLMQWAYKSDAGEDSGSDTLMNFDAELSFLNMRAYPFTLYLRRDHPEIISSISGRFLVQTNEYGIKGILREPLSPLYITWDVSHWDSYGSGAGTTVDQILNRATLRASLPYRERDNVHLILNWNERDSKSGAIGLPIQQSLIETASAELTGDNTFGDSSQMTLRHNLIWLNQKTTLAAVTELKSLGYVGTFNWKHTEATRSFANLNYKDTNRTESWTRTGGFRAGAIHDFAKNLTVSGEGDYTQDEAPGFSQNVTGVRGTGNYTRSLTFGNLAVGASVDMRRTDQVSDTDRVTIFDEAVVLVGTTPVTLSQDFVIVTSIVVTNEAKTQTFIEDLDYRVVTIGNRTSVERLITGNIGHGQSVLVTYDALTGGTVKYDTFSQGLSFNLGLWRYTNLFLNYNNSNNKVVEGTTTTPLNSVNRIELGARLDYPFTSGWIMGGEYRFIRHDEDISPNVNNRFEIYAQTARYWRTSIRLLVHHETVEYERSLEDVNLYRYLLTINSILPGGVILAYNAEYTEDTGGTLIREEERHSLSLNWAYRQVLFSLRASSSDVLRGENNRQNKRVTAMLRRVF